MAGNLADRLEDERRKLFVGREAELALFAEAITEEKPPFCVLSIHGLGGVGKTALLRNFTELCRQHNVAYAQIDGHHVEPSAQAFTSALATDLGLDWCDDFSSLLERHNRRVVVFIDTYELFTPLDSWIRECFLPQLPDNHLVVLAGRMPLSPAWHKDSAWHSLICSRKLDNLSQEESRSYLQKRQIPVPEQQSVLEFTHGHPMALSLVADLFSQSPSSNGRDAVLDSRFHFRPQSAPDMMEVLLEHLVQRTPDPVFRAALGACSLVRCTTEDLLAAMLDISDAHAAFQWLRSLSFIETGAGGIFPHDLLREVLSHDQRWRNPDQHTQMQRRARSYYLARLEQSHQQEQQEVLSSYIFLHRTNPVVSPFFEWQQSHTPMPQTARPEEFPLLTQMVARHEGAASSQLAQHWFARQPQNVLVLRDDQQNVLGFFTLLDLHKASEEDLRADPGTWTCWQYLKDHSPLRPGEGATMVRFWMAQESYQDVSTMQSFIFVSVVRHYLTTPGLAFSFFCCADADFWTPPFSYADSPHLPEADFAIEEHATPKGRPARKISSRRFGVFGHDWRVTPPMAWLELLAERELTTSTQIPAPSPHVIQILGEEEFGCAVQQALRDINRLTCLRENSLSRSRILRAMAKGDAETNCRASALQTLLRETCESLQTSPRTMKYFQALHHAYLHPVSSQEHAAELMDVSFSSYRRYLKEGVRRVTELLWQREIGF